jgi:hypothetical protein
MCFCGGSREETIGKARLGTEPGTLFDGLHGHHFLGQGKQQENASTIVTKRGTDHE